MSTWIDDVMTSRLRARREVATSRATMVIQELSARGISARIVGSLIEDRFALYSDVDFLVEKCPKQLKYNIESDVESVMLDIPFDVIYQEESETA